MPRSTRPFRPSLIALGLVLLIGGAGAIAPALSATAATDMPPLLVTEITPDTTNVGSADGYEFIEVYNATTVPINFGDYTLNYLYPLADLTNSKAVLWPSTPADVVIAPGGNLVFWIKNGQNDALTDSDFNAAFGSNLTMGRDLVEVFSGGMANGSARGIEILTNTGFSVNTAYYNLAGVDDVDPNVGIQYGIDTSNPGRQLNLGKTAANPGNVFAAQVPSDLKNVAADTTAPVITDHTLTEIDPAYNFALSATVTDNVQARTVELHLKSNIDAEYAASHEAESGISRALRSCQVRIAATSAETGIEVVAPARVTAIEDATVA